MCPQQQVRLVVTVVSLCLLRGVAWGQGETDSAPTIQLQPRHVLKFDRRPCWLSFSRDGKRFACSEGPSCQVWDTHTWKQVASFTNDDKWLIEQLVLSPDGRRVVFTSGPRNEIRILDVGSGKVLHTLSRPTKWVSSPRLSPDGKTLVAAAENDGVSLWEVETGKDLGRIPVKLLDRPLAGVKLAFSPDGGTLAAAMKDGVVHLLDVQQRKEVRQFLPTDPDLTFPIGLAFSPDGRFLAQGVANRNIVTVWDIGAGKPIWTLQWPLSRDPKEVGKVPDDAVRWDPQRPPGLWSLAFAADSRTLITASCDRRLRVWELATGRLRYLVEADHVILAAAPAGPLFATASLTPETRQVFLWDSRTCVPPLRPSALLENTWAELGMHDAARAYQRMRELASTPKEALALLDKRLLTIGSVKAAVIQGFLQELDDDRFEVRDRAKQRLAELGELARTALSLALAQNPSAEARKQLQELLGALEGPPVGDRLRLLRAVEILETIGSPESRLVLKRLADGDPGHLLTRQAKAALDRLNTN